MTGIESKIQETLVELEEGIQRMRSGGEKPDFQNLFSKLDKLTTELPASTDPQLLHYLYKKSYEKARLYLLGRDSENAQGGCMRD
ncbi:MAG: hypothetical protein LR011_10020 [Verrucomicrobia bacterium]|nr:hypothetical protein [Verrucomicrobiota bacterium]